METINQELLVTRKSDEDSGAEDVELESSNSIATAAQEEGPDRNQAARPKNGQSSGRRNPPARNTSRFWFERFLSVIQRQNPAVIDSSFLSQIAPSNEGKLLAQLKFLHVIDDSGKPTEILSLLNLVGDEQKKGFRAVAESAYGDLISEVKVDRALPDDLINFFIRKYQFPREKAVNASKFFLYLAEKAAIPVAPELASLMTEKGSNGAASSVPLALSVRNQAFAPRDVHQSQSRDAGGARQVLLSKKALRNNRFNEQISVQPSIQASITIHLDKDTPREYWDRVLALLGERNIQDNGKGEQRVFEEEDSDHSNQKENGGGA
jgi:hypothetical protein